MVRKPSRAVCLLYSLSTSSFERSYLKLIWNVATDFPECLDISDRFERLVYLLSRDNAPVCIDACSLLTQTFKQRLPIIINYHQMVLILTITPDPINFGVKSKILPNLGF